MHASKQKQTGYNSIYSININNIYDSIKSWLNYLSACTKIQQR